jgi:hypothetical protein
MNLVVIIAKLGIKLVVYSRSVKNAFLNRKSKNIPER